MGYMDLLKFHTFQIAYLKNTDFINITENKRTLIWDFL